jgi:hypothetical protein
MAKEKKKGELQNERVCGLFTESERNKLLAIADEKHWNISVLVRLAMKASYPEAFDDKKK